MSIPPLVCSTPPPLDQCDDDKNIEEFDLQYRLSQDDEDNDLYEYENYSHYDDYNQDVPTEENSEPVQSETIPDQISFSIDKLKSPPLDNDNVNDEIIIEDLNLKIDHVEHSESPRNDTVKTESESDNYEITCFVSEPESSFKNSVMPDSKLLKHTNDNINIQNVPTETTSPEETLDNLENNKTKVKPISKDEDETNSSIEENIFKESNHTDLNNALEPVSKSICIEQNHEDFDSDFIIPKNTENSSIETDSEVFKKELEFDEFLNCQSINNSLSKKLSTDTSDVFDDCEDFKTNCASTNINVIDSVENPWQSETDDFNFGDFKANFDKLAKEEIPIENPAIQENSSEIVVAAAATDDDDDFGDFDDFKSSVPETTEQLIESSGQHLTVINFKGSDNDTQVFESINNILLNIFSEDLPDPETIVEENLEIKLGESWHHLKEVDERQPYIVYWNNSLGQKTLLKALCIDSRNILFGPRWNNTTPKYATNLSVAPLKPQKPVPSTPTTQPPEVTDGDKINKDNLVWTDPFTVNGQQSSDLDKRKPSEESRPTDLDVFGNSISVTKLDKIHSSTLNVQPLRQISLPDTHIFTPTDSETPHSKTIHYDNTSSILPPQQNINLQNSIENVENNDDYWEFQDFKGSSSRSQEIGGSVEPVTSNQSYPATNSGITYQTQILQPVKVEPIIPTLNWPDPGEVKETFEDFSDFISNTSWSNENTPNKHATPNRISPIVYKTDLSECHNHDDEFENFQSAVPCDNHMAVKTTSELFVDNISISNKFKEENTSLNKHYPINTNDSLPEIKTMDSKSPVQVSNKPSQINNILQPIQAGPSSVTLPQQSGQILQPLYLESFSQINWPKPGVDLQNLSTFNPIDRLEALKSESSSSNTSKGSSPVHNKVKPVQNEVIDDDIWGEFVSSKPKQAIQKKSPVFVDDDEWTDFVSSPSPAQNSLNTISFNVQTNLSMQKSSNTSVKSNTLPMDIPTLNYITPKSNNRGNYATHQFQNL